MQRLRLRLPSERPPAAARATLGFVELVAEVLLAFAHQAEKALVLHVRRLEGHELLMGIERVVPSRQLHLRGAEQIQRSELVSFLCDRPLENRHGAVMALQLVKNPAVAVRGSGVLRIEVVGALVQRQGAIQVAAAGCYLRGQQRDVHILRKARGRRLQFLLRVRAHLPANERPNESDLRLGILRRVPHLPSKRRGDFRELRRNAVMTAAARAVIQNAVLTKRDERDEDHADPLAGVIRGERCRTAARPADIETCGAIAGAVIVRTYPIERVGHGFPSR